jgi:hypothetical protein|tara:strand:- start:640 stop:819 length:180 start_codon:yes stop_codon:yes gene_type:complete
MQVKGGKNKMARSMKQVKTHYKKMLKYATNAELKRDTKSKTLGKMFKNLSAKELEKRKK